MPLLVIENLVTYCLVFCDWLTPIPEQHCCYDSGGQVLEGSSLCSFSNAPFRPGDSSHCCVWHPQLFAVVIYGAFSFPLCLRLSSTSVLDPVARGGCFVFSLSFVFPSHCYIFLRCILVGLNYLHLFLIFWWDHLSPIYSSFFLQFFADSFPVWFCSQLCRSELLPVVGSVKCFLEIRSCILCLYILSLDSVFLLQSFSSAFCFSWVLHLSFLFSFSQGFPIFVVIFCSPQTPKAICLDDFLQWDWRVSVSVCDCLVLLESAHTCLAGADDSTHQPFSLLYPHVCLCFSALPLP